ncbi:Uncharacterised protein [Mycobacteroides abscessus subsp. bolletii]|jgi:nicotinamide riboside kinase|nr:Uncharacterised protein [Mycobacteroides abscessus subsp. bolletii]
MGVASGGKTTLVEDLGKLYNAPYSFERLIHRGVNTPTN